MPEGIEIPDSLKNASFNVDEMKKVLQEKCKKVSGNEESYKAIEEGAQKLKDCTVGLVDVEQLQKEIEEAQPSGELDTVFNKWVNFNKNYSSPVVLIHTNFFCFRYCRKRTIAIECMRNFTEVLTPCLDEKEIEGQKTFVKIFTNLLNFICHKDGDQIALFIAEKGPECFKERADELTTCMNSTFYNYMPSEKENEINKQLPVTLPQLVMGAQQCKWVFEAKLKWKLFDPTTVLINKLFDDF